MCSAGRRPQVFSFATVVAAINAVVGGSAVGIAVAAAAFPPFGVAAAAGTIAGLESIVVWLRVAARILARRVPRDPPLFPTPPAGNSWTTESELGQSA